MPRPSSKKSAAPARPSVTLKMPADLLDRIEAIAAEEDRPRSKVIEIACRQFVQTYQPRPATDPLAKHLAPPSPRERAVRGGKAA
jgi:Ribbon-helix-helix protein, copG family